MKIKFQLRMRLSLEQKCGGNELMAEKLVVRTDL